LFSIEDRAPALSIALPAEWRLVARDAFNGVTLWELPIQAWQSSKTGFRSGPVQLPRRLVAVGDRVFVALEYDGPLVCLDAATGTTQKTYQGTEGVNEILCCGGILYLVASGPDGPKGRRILAIAADSGEVLWEKSDEPAGGVLPATLTVGAGHVFFHDGQAVVALERSNGRVAWRKPLPSVAKRPSWSAPAMVYRDGVLLCGDRATDYPERWKKYPALVSGMLRHGGLAQVTALSAEDGDVLWQDEAAECFHGPVDIFVIDGLAWVSRGPARFFFERTRPILAQEFGEDFYIEEVAGRDLRTGEVKKTIDAAEAFTLAHHHRCFRNKATQRHIIMGRTGIEFINLTGGPSLRHNWTRGACQYGVMPANGLLYTPPHPCACYNASKVNGFFAYSSRKEAAWKDGPVARLHKGPAYPGGRDQVSGIRSESGKGTADSGNPKSEIPNPKSELDPTSRDSRSSDWPTYRHDNARSGCTAGSVPDRPALAWRRELPGRLSAATSADGRVFVSAVDHHTVYALDLETGKELWSHVAGGRVDSPPAYSGGRVYFGSADGAIQCVTAANGELVWRFLATPQQLSIVAWDRLESAWPVPGSVLVRDGTVYALAGRSSNLDGGVYFVKLDAVTGRPQRIKQISTRDLETGRQAEETIKNLYMPGLLYDILSSKGESIFVRETRLSLDGEMRAEPQQHLYSVGGFLDDTWWHRYYMVYGTRFHNGPGGGTGRSGGAPAGRLLVCDGPRVYGYGRANRNTYQLFCADAGAAQSANPRGGRASADTVWSSAKFPIMVRAMVLARGGDEEHMEASRLVLAGPPVDGFADSRILRGEKGGLLGVVDASTGQSLSQISIEAPPVFDGMCAARDRIVLSLSSGVVVCFE
jgi:outer membrane protein assembly factor BamB